MMRREPVNPAAEAYRAAQQWYEREHQGCSHCRQRHCVFHTVWGTRVEYACYLCDYCVSYDEETGCYYAVQGRSPLGELPLFDETVPSLVTGLTNDPALPQRDSSLSG